MQQHNTMWEMNEEPIFVSVLFNLSRSPANSLYYYIFLVLIKLRTDVGIILSFFQIFIRTNCIAESPNKWLGLDIPTKTRCTCCIVGAIFAYSDIEEYNLHKSILSSMFYSSFQILFGWFGKVFHKKGQQINVLKCPFPQFESLICAFFNHWLISFQFCAANTAADAVLSEISIIHT